MKALVLLNAKAGTLALQNGQQGATAVAEALAVAGIEADIELIPGSDLIAAARTAVDSAVDVVIAGGGDGTLSTVAGVLAGTQMPLGILPLGTLNHFARDLGIPLDLTAAAKVIAAGRIAPIDVGEVNERVFINNSSLGIYPHMVRDREAVRSRFGISKWFAMIWAMCKVFIRFPLLLIRLTTDGQIVVRQSPLVFVGNNCYQLELFKIGQRENLDRGELSLYIANAQTRWAVVKLMFRAMLGRLKQARDFDTLRLTECLIEARHHRLHVAADGEVLWMAPPLQYRVRAAVLRVCLPEISKVEVTPPAGEHRRQVW